MSDVPQYKAAALPWGCTPSRVKKILERHHRVVGISISETGVLSFGDRLGDDKGGVRVRGEAEFPNGFLTAVTLTLTVTPGALTTPARIYVAQLAAYEREYGPPEAWTDGFVRKWQSDERGSLTVSLDVFAGEVRARYASGSI